jgi:Fe-S cluster assembly scaffold protein SufB
MIYNDILNQAGEEKTLTKNFLIKSGSNEEISTVMTCAAPRTVGRTIIKAVVMDDASLKLRGMIRIEKNAEMSEGFLKQAVLLVGKNAKAEAIPELEIECNEVKASHAASVGRIDEEQMFYLMSRGLSREEAVELIIQAFLS